MKKLRQNDLFKHIDKFLKDQGIEIREAAPLGSRLKTSCQILTDTINHAQGTLGKARDHMDDHLDKMRNIIHEKTAPRKPSATAPKSKKKKPQAKKRPVKKATKAKAKPKATGKKSSRTAKKSTKKAPAKTAVRKKASSPKTSASSRKKPSRKAQSKKR